MINHLREYKGKKFLYILPVTPYPYNKITSYIVAIVEIKEIYNKFSKVKIISIINENESFPRLNYIKEHSLITTISNKYLYDFSNKNIIEKI